MSRGGEMIVEINFDGIIGPTHNYAGLSPGNLAATHNAGGVARPRIAALQGIAKMRANIALGLRQGVLLPHPRPDHDWLAALHTDYANAAPHLKARALSASAMWAANAATVSPSPDCDDGRCHLSVANLVTMPHRSHEWPHTLAQLRLAFADNAFRVHAPVLPPFGDEGAANHMRLSASHGAPGIEIFVYGVGGDPFPARQHREASEAVARAHSLNPARTLFIEQSPAAIAAGAFHNDVVAVANERTLFAHEQAFADRDGCYAALRLLMPEVQIVEVPATEVSLADAIGSYLFNAQLVTTPTRGQVLIVPQEVRDNEATWRWVQRHVAGNGPIHAVEVVDVRESMANGGGPACLRLRVACDPAQVDQRFLVDSDRLDLIAGVVREHWPETIAPDRIGDPRLIAQVEHAHAALLHVLDLVELTDR